MALDGDKLRRLRTAKGMSQEKLAILANVNKRTIQRAENGDPIALETAAFIAEAVGVSPASLRGTQLELFETENKEWDEVILVPVSSGRRLIEALRGSFEAEVAFDVEPTKDNIEPLAQLAALLEPFKPEPWEIPQAQYDPSQADVLQKQAEVNALLPSLLDMGINVFLGSYPASRQIPRYDMDEGCMYVRHNFPYRAVQVALLVVSDTTASHLMRKPDDLHVEMESRRSDLDNDIPF
ncbi:MAG: helix-turn-helix transcriptional regulator [Rhodobacteraceae bacterium]|nr:helix-turn-helix transcriptional regulator [Paracoccaceae bacterium]